MKATRREFLKALCVGAVATAINPLSAIGAEATTQSARTLDVVLAEINTKQKAVQAAPLNAELRYDLYDLCTEGAKIATDSQKQALELRGKLSFNAGVSIDMSKKTVDEILAPYYEDKSVVQVEYDGQKSNFDRLVYQADAKASARMPVLVMFYVNHDTENKDPVKAGSSKREAIILKNLVRRYKGKVNFVVQEERTDPRWAADFAKGGNNLNNIEGLPSIAMYSPWDVVKGETPKKNDGKVKQVDILRGGPTANKWIEPWLPWLTPWITTNLTQPNNKYATRMNNTGDDKKVFYNQ